MEPVSIKLSVPIRCFNENIETLVIKRRANLGDMRAMEDAGDADHPLGRMIVLVQRLCRTITDKEITLAAIESIDSEDIEALMVALGPFLPGGRRNPSGGRSSES